MLDAATQFRKAGYSDKDSATLATVATMYQNVADEEISAGEAANFVISQMKAFNLTADDAMHIIDGLNEVSNNFAVSSADLAINLPKASAALALGNNTYEQSIGMMTAIVEINRNGSKAARGLVSIQSRLNQVLDEGSSVGKKLIAIYEGLGVALFDENGQLRSSYDIFTDLSKIWPTLTTNQKDYIALIQAGADQTQNFVALMDNFGTAMDATQTALDSAGSAANENAAYMESLEAKVAAVRAEFQKLAQNIVESDLVRLGLDAAKFFLSIANTDLGQIVVQLGIIVGLLWGAKGMIAAMNLIPSLLGNITVAANGATQSVGFLGRAINLMGVGGGKALLVLLAIAVAMLAIYNLWKVWKDAHPSLEALNNDLEETKKRLEDLENVPLSNRDEQWQKEYEAAKRDREELERLTAARQKASVGGSVASVRKKYREGDESGRVQAMRGGKIIESADSMDALYKKLAQSKNIIASSEDQLKDYGITVVKLSENFTDSEQVIQGWIEEYSALQNKIASGQKLTADEAARYVELGVKLNEYKDDIRSVSPELEGLTKQERRQISTIEDLSERQGKLNKQFVDSEGYLTQLANGYTLTTQQLNNLRQAYPGLNDVLGENSQYLEQTTYGWKLNTAALLNAASAGDEYARRAVKQFRAAAQASVDSARASIAAAQASLSAIGAQDTLSAAVQRVIIATKTIELKKSQAELEKWEKEINSWVDFSGTSATVSSGGGGSKGSSGSKKSEDEALKEIYDKQTKARDHELDLMKRNGAAQEEIIKHLRKSQTAAHDYANKLRAMGLQEDHEYIIAASEDWWSYEDQIKDILGEIEEDEKESYKKRLEGSKDWIEKRNYWNDWGADNEIAAWHRVLDYTEEYFKKGVLSYEDYAKQREEILRKIVDAQKKYLEDAIDETQGKVDSYTLLFDYMVSNIDKKLDELQSERDDISDYWDDRISQVEDYNDELEKQIELEELQDALARARAKRVMVYKDGRWQYINDIEEVNEAQANLEKYEREESLKREVENLKKLKEEALKAIDEQIKAWEEYKKKWSSVVSDYKKDQDRLLLEQEFGVKLEGDLWEKRLDNLDDYISDYRDRMKELERLQEELNNMNKNPSIWDDDRWGGGSGDSGDDGGREPDINTPAERFNYRGRYYDVIDGEVMDELGNTIADYSRMFMSALNEYKVTKSSAAKRRMIEANVRANRIREATDEPLSWAYDNLPKGIEKQPWYSEDVWNYYAKGTRSAQGGISLVGENGPEMRVLNQGDGILPAHITDNLWKWGSITPADMIANVGAFGQNLGQTISIAIENFNPNLPNVHDGEEFASYLKDNFWRATLQFITS